MNALDVMVKSTRCIRLKKALFQIIIFDEGKPRDVGLPEMEDAIRTLLATSDSLQFLELDLMPCPDTGGHLIHSALKMSMFELPRIEQRPEYSPDINGDGEEMHIFYNVGCKINGYSESWMMQ